MQHFRGNLTRLRSSMASNLPDTDDIYSYKGVSKGVLLSAIDLANDLSKGIESKDESRFEVIALKRAGSDLYKRLKDYFETDTSETTKKEKFNGFLDDLSALIEKNQTYLLYRCQEWTKR